MQVTPFTWLERGNMKAADAHTHQALYLILQGLKHAPNLPIHPLMQHQTDMPRRDHLHRICLCYTFLHGNAFHQFCHIPPMEWPIYDDPVFFLHVFARMGEALI
jgi:hypothetical protein